MLLNPILRCLQIKKLIKGDREKEITIIERFAAGSTAGATAQTCIYPMEVSYRTLSFSLSSVWRCSSILEVLESCGSVSHPYLCLSLTGDQDTFSCDEVRPVQGARRLRHEDLSEGRNASTVQGLSPKSAGNHPLRGHRSHNIRGTSVHRSPEHCIFESHLW